MKRLLIGILAWAALLALSAQAAPANALFKHIGIEEGLSQSTVFAILQDRQGLMWLGTKAGLNRYDATHIKVYRHATIPHALGNECVNALYEAPDGQIWVGTEKGVYLYSPKDDAFSRFDVRSADGATITGNVNAITGHQGEVYVAANEQGLFCYNLQTGKMAHHRLADHPNISSVSFDSRGILWLGFYFGGLYYSTDRLHTLHPFKTQDGAEPLAGDIPSRLVDVGGQRLFVGTSHHGLCELLPARWQMRVVVDKEDGKNIFVRDVRIRGQEVWAASEMGLYAYHTKSGQLRHFQNEPSNPFSLSDNPLYSLCVDREGGLWAGSYFGGANYLSSHAPLFEKFFPQLEQPTSLRGRRVREMCQDGAGRIWIGTEDNGLHCMNPQTGRFDYVAESAAFPNVHGLCVDGDKLWVGTFSYGLRLIDMATRRVVRTYVADGKPGSLRDNNVFAICLTREGELWIGTTLGLYLMDRTAGTFQLTDALPPIHVNCIREDRHGNLWVATQSAGIYCRRSKGRGAKGESKEQGTWQHYGGRTSGLTTDKVNSVFEDTEGHIWAATHGGGVCRYDSGTNRFQPIPIPREAFEPTVFQIVEDHQGILWLSTYKGIMRYNPQTGDTRLYTISNGLLDNQFNYSSSLLSADGRIYFGSLNGFVRFLPEALARPMPSPDIIATELHIGNTVVDNFTKGSPLKENITLTRQLTLAHHQNTFSIRVAALSYAIPMGERMEYMLEGYDKDWQRLRPDNYIAYANVPAGHYQLRVRIKADDGTWAKKQYTLDITVRPHPLLSTWAQLAYLLLAAGLAWLLYRHLSRRNRLRRQQALDRLEHEKEQELYQSKIRFFTNVAHEIRTPLTLIKGPLENIIGSRKVADPSVAEDLDVMYQNTSRLSDLINQLLDFRKAESDGMRLNYVRCDIGKLLAGIYERFRPLMRERGIEATLTLPPQAVLAHVDHEALTKMVSNLMGNAVKYCAGHMAVSLTQDERQGTFALTFANDGPLIPPTLREKIFTPFFRMESAERSSTTGTGIGLAMARSLAELHNGHLCMVDDDALNVFRLTLPLRQEGIAAMDAIASPPQPDATFVPTHDHTVLIVEDNVQLRQYEARHLQDDYDIVTAADGEEALRQLGTHAVDAIVTDVMMEPMDGMELCRRVKQDVDFSHIPLILLTAVTTRQAKVQGMELGADAYIEKPFSMDYLRSTLQNLLRSREDAKRAYAESPFVGSDTVSISPADADSLARLQAAMDKHMGNSDFNVDQMASEMNMSRTSLNRKMRGTLNLSTNEYIKIERLKRAAQLLKAGNSKINEVCYQVGFSTPSYFTKCFYKQFGLLPKEFIST